MTGPMADRAGPGDALPIPPDAEASLVLVRHGESTWIAEGLFQGAADPPLSDRGRAQARLVGDRLSDVTAAPALPIPVGPPVVIWHSPLERARATAEAIAAGCPGARVVDDPDLREIAQGAWEGLRVSEILEHDGERLRAWRRAPVGNEAPGGETLAAVDLRARAALTRIVADLAGASRSAPAADVDRPPVVGYEPDRSDRPWGVAVAHDGLFRVAMLALLGMPLERFWTFPFVPAGITVLELRGGICVVRAHDLADHLAPLDGTAPVPEGAL